MTQRPKDYSQVNIQGSLTDFVEQRQENDANGNPLYTAYSYKPNASTTEEVWFITKQTWDGNNALTRRQLPDSGVKFAYAYDSRATYFS